MKKREAKGKTILDQMDESLLERLSRFGADGFGDSCPLFPRGERDIIRHFHDWADRQMLKESAKRGFDKRKVREKVASLVQTRLEALAPYKSAVQAALAYHAKPWHSAEGLKALCTTVDAIWIAAGDTATDYNYYTKRGLLSGVYSATLLYWLSDTSKNHAATWDFLEKRIANVLTLGKWTRRRTAA